MLPKSRTEGLLALDPGHHIEVLLRKIERKFDLWKAEEGWELEILASQAWTNSSDIFERKDMKKSSSD